MTGTDKAIHWPAIAAVTVVALVAASVSYPHALEVVSQHGEPGFGRLSATQLLTPGRRRRQ